MVRAARRGRVPLRRAGARRLPAEPRRRWTTASGPSTCSSATTPRACSASAGRTPPAAAAGSTPNATPSRTSSRGSTPRRRRERWPGEHRHLVHGARALPHRRRRPHRPTHRVLEFRVGGQVLTAHPGDTVASALLAHGRHQVGTSIKLGRPRGIGAAWAEDPGGLLQVEEPFPEPMLLATTVEVFDGLAVGGSRARAAWRRSRTPPATTAGTCTSTSSSSARGRRACRPP